MAVKLSDLTAESSPAGTDILLIADPTTGIAKKITATALKIFLNGLDTALATPTLTATVISATQIDLSWTNVANESSYKLEWSPNGSTSWTQIGGTIAANTTTYSHTGLTASTAYYYRITAVGDGVTYSDSGYGTDDATTSAGTSYLTWLSLGRNSQINTNKGIEWDGVASGTEEAYANETLSSGQELVMKVPDVAGSQWRVGLNDNTTDVFNGWYYTVNLNGNYGELEGTSFVDSGVGGAVNDLIKIKYAGTQLTIERSTNAGVSWTVIETDSRSASGSYNIGFRSVAGGPNEIYIQ